MCRWMRQSGLAEILPLLRETVYVGLSAGSMVMAPNIGEGFVSRRPPTGDDRTLSRCSGSAPFRFPGANFAFYDFFLCPICFIVLISYL